MTMQFGRKQTRLTFPNPSRSYDAKKSCIHFSGYDGTKEVYIIVEAGLLAKFSSFAEDTEFEFLKAFDIGRERIYAIAVEVYARNRKGSADCVLVAEDF